MSKPFVFQHNDMRTVRELRALAELMPTPVLISSAELMERLLKFAYGVNSFEMIEAAKAEVVDGTSTVGECEACRNNRMACIGRCLMA